jgi:hypothetical protein
VDYKWRDFRPDLNGDWVVDFKDFAFFANHWRPGPTAGGISFDGEPNNLSGYVTMSIAEQDANTYRVFTLIDGQLYREFFIDTEWAPAVGIHTERFANGPHSIKIVSIDMYGNVMCSQTNEVVFNNELSMLTRSNGFEPGKDFILYASGSGNYTVEVNDIVTGEVIYNQSFIDDINAKVPASCFTDQSGIYRFSINNSQSFLVGSNFNKKDYPQNSDKMMVISIGSEDVGKAKEACWTAVKRVADSKGILTVLLDYENCTWENLKHCLMLDNVKMWYHVSHGNDQVRRYKRIPGILLPQRTCVEINGGLLFSYVDEGMGGYQNNPSVAELGYANSGKMTFIQINACESLKYPDFAIQMGMDSDYNRRFEPPYSQIYIGWYNPAFVYDIITEYNRFEVAYWNSLSDGYSVKSAVEAGHNAISHHTERDPSTNFRYYGAYWDAKQFHYPE